MNLISWPGLASLRQRNFVRPFEVATPAVTSGGSNSVLVHVYVLKQVYEHRGALRGTPGSAYPQPEPNATELPSSAPGRPKLVELQAPAPSPTPTRAEEHIASAPSPAAARRRELRTSPSCRPRRASRGIVQRLRRRATLPRFAPSRTRALAPVTELQTSSRFARAESFSTFGAARPCRASRPRALARRRAPKRTPHVTFPSFAALLRHE